MDKARRLLTALVLSLLMTAPAAAAQTALYFKSTPGDWIGQGQEVLLTTEDIDFFPRINFDNGVSFWMHNFGRDSWPNTIWWGLNFAAPYNARITEGLYTNAARFPFQAPDQPGLDFFGNGRGCNRLAGEFEVLEAVYDPITGLIVSFAADFTQVCEIFMPPLFGAIRYNSDVPLPRLVPPKITLVNALNTEGCVEASGPDGATVSLTGSTVSEVPVNFTWSTAAGQLAYGQDFSFLLGVDQTTTVTLTIEDPVTGEQAQSTLDVCVSDTTPPVVTILSPLNGAVFVGENARLTVQVSDLVDKNITSVRKLVGETATLLLDAANGTSDTMLFRKINGDPVLIQVTAEARDYSGNVGTGTVMVYQVHDLGN